jgi:hypothetical protein
MAAVVNDPTRDEHGLPCKGRRATRNEWVDSWQLSARHREQGDRNSERDQRWAKHDGQRYERKRQPDGYGPEHRLRREKHHASGDRYAPGEREDECRIAGHSVR